MIFLGSYLVVSPTWRPAGINRVLHPYRHVGSRMHFLWDGFWQTALPRIHGDKMQCIYAYDNFCVFFRLRGNIRFPWSCDTLHNPVDGCHHSALPIGDKTLLTLFCCHEAILTIIHTHDSCLATWAGVSKTRYFSRNLLIIKLIF